jgi:hypothetical protein
MSEPERLSSIVQRALARLSHPRDRKFGVHDLDRVDGPVSIQTATRCACGRDRVIAGRCVRCGVKR